MENLIFVQCKKMVLGMVLKIYSSVARGLKLKILSFDKVFRTNYCVLKRNRGKTDGGRGGGFLPSPSILKGLSEVKVKVAVADK